jgi:acyl carrier protein
MDERILAKMRGLVADSLALGVEEIAPESRLIPDLGADSLDFVDLIFMIEKEFGIKFRDGELASVATLDFSAPEVMQDGHLTPETVGRLMEWLPALKDVEDQAMVTPTQLFSLISVETLCSIVEKRLAAS